MSRIDRGGTAYHAHADLLVEMVLYNLDPVLAARQRPGEPGHAAPAPPAGPAAPP